MMSIKHKVNFDNPAYLVQNENINGFYSHPHHKIVRDKIDAIIQGGMCRILSHDEKKIALREKLVEEATEQIEAQTPEAELEEIADVYAVLEELSTFYGGMEAVKKAARKKSDERGGFERGLFLVFAMSPNPHKDSSLTAKN